MSGLRTTAAIVLLTCGLLGQSADVGLGALRARMGVNTPTGAGVIVGQVEAGSVGAYGPNQGLPEMSGKNFMPLDGTPGNFGHATTVARNFFGRLDGGGNPTSVAPGISDIFLWTASGWLQGSYLRANFGATVPPAPAPPGVRIMNNSWIASFGSTVFDNVALRRADFAALRDSVLMINGVNNGTTGNNTPIMSHAYNGIAVGRNDGNHVSAATLPTLDGPGRMKPEIVAPGSATSFATPVVSAVAALLIETARTDPSLTGDPSAESPLVTKAVLLAGAEHRAGWSNQPATSGSDRGVTATPLDPVYGVDVVNVDRSHRILVGAEHDGDVSPAAAPLVPAHGWDLATVSSGGARYWRFHVADLQMEVSVVATWRRLTDATYQTSTVADFDLELLRVDAQGNLQSLVGPDGTPYFVGGNVASQSLVDNVEHLYVNGLAPGDYILSVVRVDGLAFDWDVATAWHLDGATFEGTNEDLDLTTLVNGTGDPRASLKAAVPGSVVELRLLSPMGNLDGATPLLAAQLFQTATPPTSLAAFLHLDLSSVLFLLDGAQGIGPSTLPGGGIPLGFTIPAGLSGFTARIQGLVFSRQARNGSFAVSPARDIVFP